MKLEDIENKLKLFGVPTTDIQQYEFAPMNDEFQKITDFYNITLDNLKIYGLSPAVFYINNSTNFRALAWRKNKLGVVNISPGVVKYLIENIKNDQTNLSKILSGSINRDTQFIEGINDFMYIYTMHYIIYHESAHLIQNQNRNDQAAIDFDESQEKSETFDFHIHALETDADEFAALSMAEHLVQYFQQVNEKNFILSSNNVNDYIVSGLTPIMLTMIEQQPHFSQFYIREMKHPHPAIRLIYMSMTIIEYLNQAYIKPSRMKLLDHSAIIINSFNAVSEHLRLTKVDLRVQLIPEMVSKNYSEIMLYFEELKDEQKKVDILAVTAWNNNAKK